MASFQQNKETIQTKAYNIDDVAGIHTSSTGRQVHLSSQVQLFAWARTNVMLISRLDGTQPFLLHSLQKRICKQIRCMHWLIH